MHRSVAHRNSFLTKANIVYSFVAHGGPAGRMRSSLPREAGDMPANTSGGKDPLTICYEAAHSYPHLSGRLVTRSVTVPRSRCSTAAFRTHCTQLSAVYPFHNGARTAVHDDNGTHAVVPRRSTSEHTARPPLLYMPAATVTTPYRIDQDPAVTSHHPPQVHVPALAIKDSCCNSNCNEHARLLQQPSGCRHPLQQLQPAPALHQTHSQQRNATVHPLHVPKQQVGGLAKHLSS